MVAHLNFLVRALAHHSLLISLQRLPKRPLRHAKLSKNKSGASLWRGAVLNYHRLEVPAWQ